MVKHLHQQLDLGLTLVFPSYLWLMLKMTFASLLNKTKKTQIRVISVILGRGPPLAHCYTLFIFIIELLSYY